MRRVFLIFLLLILVACQDDNDLKVEDLPEGNAANGEQLFSQQINGAPSCSSCHLTTNVPSTGPGLEGYGQEAGERKDGESAEDYTFNSIIRPAHHLVNGFSNVMYRDYGDKLSPQQIADLIAYLLQL